MIRNKFYRQHLIASLFLAGLYFYLANWTKVPWWLSLIGVLILGGLVGALIGGLEQFNQNSMLRTEAEILFDVVKILKSLPEYAGNYSDKNVQASLLDICAKAQKIADQLGSDSFPSLREADALLGLLERLEKAVVGYAQIKVSDHSLKQQLLAEGESLIETYHQSFNEVVDQMGSQDVMAYRHALKTAFVHLGVSGYLPDEESGKRRE